MAEAPLSPSSQSAVRKQSQTSIEVAVYSPVKWAAASASCQGYLNVCQNFVCAGGRPYLQPMNAEMMQHVDATRTLVRDANLSKDRLVQLHLVFQQLEKKVEFIKESKKPWNKAFIDNNLLQVTKALAEVTTTAEQMHQGNVRSSEVGQVNEFLTKMIDKMDDTTAKGIRKLQGEIDEIRKSLTPRKAELLKLVRDLAKTTGETQLQVAKEQQLGSSVDKLRRQLLDAEQALTDAKQMLHEEQAATKKAVDDHAQFVRDAHKSHKEKTDAVYETSAQEIQKIRAEISKRMGAVTDARCTEISTRPPVTACHFIFLLDRSYSMTGSDGIANYMQGHTRWTQTTAALEDCLPVGDTKSDDVVSVILFDDRAQLVTKEVNLQAFQRKEVQQIKKEQPQGGTNVKNAFTAVQDLVSTCDLTNKQPCIIFMTDGEFWSGELTQATEVAVKLKEKYTNLATFVIPFCVRDHSPLRDLAHKANGGKTHFGDTAELPFLCSVGYRDLGKAFKRIVEGSVGSVRSELQSLRELENQIHQHLSAQEAKDIQAADDKLEKQLKSATKKLTQLREAERASLQPLEDAVTRLFQEDSMIHHQLNLQEEALSRQKKHVQELQQVEAEATKASREQQKRVEAEIDGLRKREESKIHAKVVLEDQAATQENDWFETHDRKQIIYTILNGFKEVVANAELVQVTMQKRFEDIVDTVSAIAKDLEDVPKSYNRDEKVEIIMEHLWEMHGAEKFGSQKAMGQVRAISSKVYMAICEDVYTTEQIDRTTLEKICNFIPDIISFDQLLIPAPPPPKPGTSDAADKIEKDERVLMEKILKYFESELLAYLSHTQPALSQIFDDQATLKLKMRSVQEKIEKLENKIEKLEGDSDNEDQLEDLNGKLETLQEQLLELQKEKADLDAKKKQFLTEYRTEFKVIKAIVETLNQIFSSRVRITELALFTSKLGLYFTFYEKHIKAYIQLVEQMGQDGKAVNVTDSIDDVRSHVAIRDVLVQEVD